MTLHVLRYYNNTAVQLCPELSLSLPVPCCNLGNDTLTAQLHAKDVPAPKFLLSLGEDILIDFCTSHRHPAQSR